MVPVTPCTRALPYIGVVGKTVAEATVHAMVYGREPDGDRSFT